MIKQTFLLSTIVILICITQSEYVHTGELSTVEILQESILLAGLLVTLMNRKILLKSSNKLGYFLKVSLFSFFLYEEISFTTKNISGFFNTVNRQAEINFHNLYFVKNIFQSIVFENIQLPILNYSIDLSFSFIFYSSLLFFFGFGSYLSAMKKFNILFLKKYSLFSFI